MLTRVGVTGTDTGVGKTVVAAALIATLRRAGIRVAAMKPVETGGGDDAIRLRAAAGDVHAIDLVRPIALVEPLAPLVATRRAHARIDTGKLDHAFQQLQRDSETIVVEGAGGLLVPVTDTETFATLFKRWELELIIVAANRLGAINHTLLTVECARTHGLPVRAVILNTVTGEPPGLAEQTNEGVLKELLPAIHILSLPHLRTPHDAVQMGELMRDILPLPSPPRRDLR